MTPLRFDLRADTHDGGKAWCDVETTLDGECLRVRPEGGRWTHRVRDVLTHEGLRAVEGEALARAVPALDERAAEAAEDEAELRAIERAMEAA